MHLPLTMAVGKCLAMSFSVALIWFIYRNEEERENEFHYFLLF